MSEEEEETFDSTTSEDAGSRVKSRGSHVDRLHARARSNSAPVRVGQFRPFLSSAQAKTRYRSSLKPPSSLAQVLEGHESAEDGYENLLKNQVVGLFDGLFALVVPSGSSGKDESTTKVDEKTRHARSKSISSRHKPNIMKELAAQQVQSDRPSLQNSQNITASLVAEAGNEVGVKYLVEEMGALMDQSESLMLVEDLSWAGLFHERFLYTNRLLKQSELDQLKSLVECFLANSPLDDVCRKQASKLMQYVVCHQQDPDGALLGLPPCEELRLRLQAARAEVYGENAPHPELREKILSFDAGGAVCSVPSSALSHGMILLAMLEHGFAYVRFSRVDPTRTSVVQVWTNAKEKEMRCMDMGVGVFLLDEAWRCRFSSDPKVLGSLVFNPLTPLQDEVASYVQEKVSALLRDSGCDMYLLGLTEAQLAGEELDLSRYEQDGVKLEGQALCTKFLSLFDIEKKKLLTVRANVKQADMEQVCVYVSKKVEAFMSRVDTDLVFAPQRKQEIEICSGLGVRSISIFQVGLDGWLAHLEALIDFVIVNWKKLSDAKLRRELKSSAVTSRPRTFSRGSVKTLFSQKPEEAQPSPVAPKLRSDNAAAASPSTPDSKKKTLRNIFGSSKK